MNAISPRMSRLKSLSVILLIPAWLAAGALLGTGSLLSAQDRLVYESGGELIREQAAYSVDHYEINLKVNPADSTIAGDVVVHGTIVHPTDLIILDLDPRLSIGSVRELLESQKGRPPGGAPNAEGIGEERDGAGEIEWQELRVVRTEESKRFRVYFPQTRQPGEDFKIQISYGGSPKIAANPPWDGGFVWDRTPSGEPWIGVACQTIGAWVWWPNKDHPSDKPHTVAMNFTLPDHLVVAANGRLKGTSRYAEGWKTWHWFSSNPISNYNVTLNAAPYEVIRETYTSITGEEMEISFWVLPEYLEKGRNLFPQFAKQLRFLEDLLGPYPFRNEKYGVAHTPYLGMEHQTIIGYGASFRDDNMFGQNVGFDDLHQHELAHEWWGNMVTVWDWRDFWIHEGFGTYMQALYAEHLGGKSAYREMMDMMRNRIIAAEEIAPRQWQSTVDIYGVGRGGDIYFKGAWVLSTLRWLIGDELFFQSLRRFAYPDPELENVTDGSQVRFVTTEDYLNLVNELTGEQLDWFFEVYLRSPGLPRLRMMRDGEELKLRWSTTRDLDFPMPLEIEIDGELKRLAPDEGVFRFELPEGKDLRVDPHNRILKRSAGSVEERPE